VAIFDATNTTRERRAWICDELKATGAKVIFIESICRDDNMVRQNIMHSKVGVKDYEGVDTAAAVADFEARIKKYEDVYEELGDTERHLTYPRSVAARPRDMRRGADLVL
jgi:6-phosphofructo-2-kinase/fructose-2,6-biphosphatase 2